MGALMHTLLADQQRLRNETTLRAVESTRIDPPEDKLEDWEIGLQIATALADIDCAQDHLNRAAGADCAEDQDAETRKAERAMTDAGLCLLGDRVEQLVGALRNVMSRLTPTTHGDIGAMRDARRAVEALGMTL